MQFSFAEVEDAGVERSIPDVEGEPPQSLAMDYATHLFQFLGWAWVGCLHRVSFA